eukprot:364431-Chlamydomonas_euryale.AAC.3
MRPSPPHLTAVTACEWLEKDSTHCRVAASQTLMVLSLDPVAKRAAGRRLCAGSQEMLRRVYIGRGCQTWTLSSHT